MLGGNMEAMSVYLNGYAFTGVYRPHREPANSLAQQTSGETPDAGPETGSGWRECAPD